MNADGPIPPEQPTWDVLLDALDRMSDGIVIYDADDRQIHRNSAYVALYGYSENQLLPGATVRDMLETDVRNGVLTRAEMEDYLAQRARQKEDGTGEFEVQLADGRWVQVRDRQTSFGGTVAIHTDITERKAMEAELQAHAKDTSVQLQAILEHVPHGIAYLDRDGTLRLGNAAFYDAMDFPRSMETGTSDEAFTRHILQVTTDLDGDALDAAVRARMSRIDVECESGAVSVDVETLNDGRVVEIRRRRNPQGHLVSTYIDITERQNALLRAQNLEALASEKSSQLEAILHNTAEGVTIFDTDLNLMLMNDGYSKMLFGAHEHGYSLGTSMLEMSRDSIRGEFGLEGVALEAQARKRVAKTVAAAKDGLPRLERFGDGRIAEVRRHVTPDGFQIAIFSDVTEREHQAAELRAAAERYRAVVDDQTEMICRFDADYHLTFANGAYRAVFERPGQKIVGTRFLDLIPDVEAREAIVRGLERLTPEAPILRDTYRETTVDGVATWQTWINRAIFEEDGTLLEYQAVGRDVTSEREAREALAQSEKMSAMGSLLANVSHELNNPLSIIVGQSQLLEELSGDPKTRERAALVRTAAERCARIVKTFLAMARQKPPNPDAVPIVPLLNDAIELVDYSMKADGIEVVFDKSNVDLVVIGDRDQLVQVAMNILINAQQALVAHDGDRRINIDCWSIDRQIVVEIRDTGPGVPPHVQARMFEPFFTTKPEGTGTGIGLAVCRNIVEGHGGSLEVSSAEDGGARFTIHLPAPNDTQVRAAGAVENMEAWRLLPALSILFVDDEAEIAATVSELLEVDGHHVRIASNGEEALQILERDDIDLVISDLRMPVLDGPGLWRRLDETGLYPTARVGFVTGDTLGPTVRRFVDQVQAPLLEKPFQGLELRQLVLEILAQEI